MDAVHGAGGEAVAMPLITSVLIALCGVLLLVVSSRYSGADNGGMTAALLSDELMPESEAPAAPFAELQSDKRFNLWAARIIGALIIALFFIVCRKTSVVSLFFAMGIGALAGELYTSRRRENEKKLKLRRMEFYLPTVMERIVMAVGSGLDIIPALREAALRANDPVSELMRWVVQLAESGVPVEAAFEMAAQQPLTPSVKHACLHLGLAYRQGGEIVRPLRELSDATQVAYQETVEEQIARLPVKAVLPLVLTFTGLIICFITIPLMQVGSLTKEVVSAVHQ